MSIIPEKATWTETRQEQSISESVGRVDFGGESSLPPPPELTPEQEKKLWRKIDYRLMPILSALYLMSFLDRGTITRP